jgi:hypothetical protein
MHYARLEKSKRLQRVLSALKRRKRLSTMQIINLLDVCAVNSIISEIRRNGYVIVCKREGGAWYYSLQK